MLASRFFSKKVCGRPVSAQKSWLVKEAIYIHEYEKILNYMNRSRMKHMTAETTSNAMQISSHYQRHS